MRHHLTPPLQQAHDILYSNPNAHPPLLSPAENITNPTDKEPPTSPTPPLPPPPRTNLLYLLTLFTALTALTFAVLYTTYHHFLNRKDPTTSYELLGSQNRKGKHKPSPLNLTLSDQDLESAPPSTGHQNPFSPPRPSPSSANDENTVLSATATDISLLTPFTPARARAQRFGEGKGDIETGDRDGEGGESPMGLGRYFFGNGMGVRRYESGEPGRGWKDG